MCLHWGNTVNWQLPTLEQHFNLHTSGYKTGKMKVNVIAARMHS